MCSPVTPGFLENQSLHVRGQRHGSYTGEVDQKPGAWPFSPHQMGGIHGPVWAELQGKGKPTAGDTGGRTAEVGAQCIYGAPRSPRKQRGWSSRSVHLAQNCGERASPGSTVCFVHLSSVTAGAVAEDPGSEGATGHRLLRLSPLLLPARGILDRAGQGAWCGSEFSPALPVCGRDSHGHWTEGQGCGGCGHCCL